MVTRLEPWCCVSDFPTRTPLSNISRSTAPIRGLPRQSSLPGARPLPPAARRCPAASPRPSTASPAGCSGRPRTFRGRFPAAAANPAERSTSPKRAACSALTAASRSASALTGYGLILYPLLHGHKGRPSNPQFPSQHCAKCPNAQTGAGGGIRRIRDLKVWYSLIVEVNHDKALG